MDRQFAQPKGSTSEEVNKQSIARLFGVKQSEVCYAKPGTVLDGYKVIYNRVTQRAYSLPSNIPFGSIVTSMDNHILVHSSGLVDLGSLAVQRGEYVKRTETFNTGFIVTSPNELFQTPTGWVRYTGTIPTTGIIVPAGSADTQSFVSVSEGNSGRGVTPGTIEVNSQPVSNIATGVGLVGSYDANTYTYKIDTVATHSIGNYFVGIYETLQDLTDSIPTPANNFQAIVISPSEHYYHSIGSQWVEMAPLGNIHPSYVGAFDTVQDLQLAEPNAADKSLAIVGSSNSRGFYLKEGNQWLSISSIDNRDISKEIADRLSKFRFIDLADTETNYKGLAGLPVKVRSDEQGLEIGKLPLNYIAGMNLVDLEPGDTLVYVGGGWQNEHPLSPIHAKVFGDGGIEYGEVVSKTSNIVFFRNGKESSINTPIALNGDILWIVNENTDKSQVVSILPANNASVEGSLSPYKVNSNQEVILVYSDKEDDWIVSLSRNYSGQNGGLAIAARPSDITSVKRISFPTSDVDTTRDGTVEVVPNIKFTKILNAEGDEGPVSKIKYMPPLKVTIPINTKDTAVLEVAEGSYAPCGCSSYLAYLPEEEFLRGRSVGDGDALDGSLGLSSIIYSSGSFITGNPSRRSITINKMKTVADSPEEDYLIAASVGMIGLAPQEGYVRLYIRSYGMEGGITDINGQTMAYQRNYKKGDLLGVVSLAGILHLETDSEEIQLVTESSFTDLVQLGDRVTGPTGLLIQGMSETISTSPAANQWQHDTGFILRFSKHEFRDDISDFNWLLQNDSNGTVSVPAGNKVILPGGYHLHPITSLKYSISGNSIEFSNDPESNSIDFTFGKVFSAEKTALLVNKVVTFAYQSSINMMPTGFAAVKWTGLPDKQLTPIFLNRDGSGNPVLQQGWEIFWSSEQGEGVTGIVEGDFTIPEDARNFAIIMYPKVPHLSVDIINFYRFQTKVNPFDGYVLNPLITVNEQLARFSPKQIVLNMGDFSTGGLWMYVSATTDGGPLPVGVVDSGYDLVKIDHTLPIPKEIVGNEVSGAGGIVFTKAGSVTVSTSIHLYTSRPVGEIDRARFWYAKVTGSEPLELTKLDDSETEMSVWGTADTSMSQTGTMRTFTINVNAGDKIVLMGRSDKDRSVYIYAKSSTDWMLHTTMIYNSFN